MGPYPAFTVIGLVIVRTLSIYMVIPPIYGCAAEILRDQNL